MKRIYISGPMSNMPEHNFPAFHAAAARIRSLGYEVINPAELNPDPGMTWHECLRVDIRELTMCDTLALLPGWQHSQGANLELHVAHRLGLTVVETREIVLPAGDRRVLDLALDMVPQWPEGGYSALAERISLLISACGAEHSLTEAQQDRLAAALRIMELQPLTQKESTT